MKDIVLITNYWHFEEERESSRYFTLARMITQAGMKLEVVTSSFYHATKSKRKLSKDYLNSFPYKITLIDEPGYTKNISLKRLLSQWIFGRNVIKYLKSRTKPDLIYCVVPSLEAADLITKYANKHNIKIVIDIQDLWPEAFRMKFSIPFVSDLLLYPFKLKADKIYSRADEIVAVSQTYINRAIRYNQRCKRGHCVYLGLELEKFDGYAYGAKEIIKPENELWIAYVGSLGYSYDLTGVMDAISLIQNKNLCPQNKKIVFQVMGDGPRRKEFEEYAKIKGVNAVFTGKLDYPDMVKRLCRSDIAVNPIVKNSAASIINKHADYAAAGLVVVNTQKSKEYRYLLEKYRAGLNCKTGDAKDLAKKLLYLINNPDIRRQMGQNHRKLAIERFDRNKTYLKIIKLLEDEIKENSSEKNMENKDKFTFQILLSTMNQKDHSLLDQMNIQSDAIVINQCDRNQWEEFEYKGKHIKWISANERGVGLSRNTALMRATADICLFADDDIRYIDGYEKKILNAFKELPDADVIIFDTEIINKTKEILNPRKIKKTQRLHVFNSMRYGTYRIAIKREKILQKNIYFSLLFGGGAQYSAGEDSLFIRECLKNKLKLYAYPLVIGCVDDSKSSWYQGITDKYLIDKGAFLSAAFPILYPVLFVYYALRLRGKGHKKFKFFEIIIKFIYGRKVFLIK